jgi:hypothetical protein
MSAYGKVISGGKAMSKGLTKGINEKLEEFAESHTRSKTIATSVLNAFKANPFNEPHTQNINGGKFTAGKRPSKI